MKLLETNFYVIIYDRVYFDVRRNGNRHIYYMIAKGRCLGGNLVIMVTIYIRENYQTSDNYHY